MDVEGLLEDIREVRERGIAATNLVAVPALAEALMVAMPDAGDVARKRGLRDLLDGAAGRLSPKAAMGLRLALGIGEATEFANSADRRAAFAAHFDRTAETVRRRGGLEDQVFAALANAIAARAGSQKLSEVVHRTNERPRSAPSAPASPAPLGPTADGAASDGDGSSARDAYHAFADGVLAYARLLSEERRDPALVELRDNTSHTLHEMGFHSERIALGELALVASMYVGDTAKSMEIRIDELAWARYLNGETGALEQIQDAIRSFERRDAGASDGLLDARLTRVAAKAYRHKSAMLAETDFGQAVDAILQAESLARRLKGIERKAQLAHASFGHAQIIATTLGIAETGIISTEDPEAQNLVRTALDRLSDAEQAYEELRDHGRVAKSLVLRVRLLCAKGDTRGAQVLTPVRDRAVAASNWSRDGLAVRFWGPTRAASVESALPTMHAIVDGR